MAFQRTSALTCVSAFLLLVALSGLAIEGQSMESRVDCRDLSAESCAFAVDIYGARCVLETFTDENGDRVYHCQTSEILSSKGEQYIESDDCVYSCGLDRMTVGISTDEFFLPGFAEMLCSIECQKYCTNIVDLFSSIVASTAEGTSLDRFCSDFHAYQGHRREMRANVFSVSELSGLHGISLSSSVESAEAPLKVSAPVSSIIAEAPGFFF